MMCYCRVSFLMRQPPSCFLGSVVACCTIRVCSFDGITYMTYLFSRCMLFFFACAPPACTPLRFFLGCAIKHHSHRPPRGVILSCSFASACIHHSPTTLCIIGVNTNVAACIHHSPYIPHFMLGVNPKLASPWNSEVARIRWLFVHFAIQYRDKTQRSRACGRSYRWLPTACLG